MAHLDDDDDEIIRGMLEADESGPPDNPCVSTSYLNLNQHGKHAWTHCPRELPDGREEQQRRQRAYEEQMIYEESKARFLHDQLKQDLIEGNVSS